MSSIKINFAYNLILTICGYFVPLITYPYVSRVLGVDQIGVCNFVDGIINYFILLSTWGVGSFGIREIAKYKNEISERNKVFSNLLFINFIGTILALILLISSTYCIPALSPYKEFLWVGAVKLLFNMFLIEWFFQGLQNFKYITIRTLIIKLFYVFLVFLFVKKQDDAIIYYCITVLTVILNATINWNYSKKFRRFLLYTINIKAYIIPVLVFGYYRILTSMYTTFNVVFLGFSAGDKEVGYFSTATKLHSVFMGLFTAFTTVMVPKVSELLHKGEHQYLQEVANKTFSVLSSISLPIIFLCFFCADEIIYLLSGPGYEGATTPFRIIVFLIFVIGLEQIVIQQFLMASTSNKSIFTVSSTGALVGLLSNFSITPLLGAVGSAISWGGSELSVLLVGLYFLNREMGIKLNFLILGKSILWSFLYVFGLFFISKLHLGMAIYLTVSVLLCFVLFLLINIVLNPNKVFIDSLKKIVPNSKNKNLQQ